MSDRWQKKGAFFGNVVLNFTTYPKGELDGYAHAYHTAANLLAEAFSKQKGYSDLEACPIVFLYRHSIELYLKAIIFWGSGILRLNGKESINLDRVFSTHSLRELLIPTRTIIQEVGWSGLTSNVRFGTFEEIDELVCAFEKIDPRSFSFRYPVDTKGNSPLPTSFSFNVLMLAEEADAMLGMLGACATGIYEMFQNEASILNDYR